MAGHSGRQGAVGHPDHQMRMGRICSQRLRGFTLIEVLVAIGIISLLTALVIPAVMAARESARRIECGNQMRQLIVALHSYAEMFERVPNAQWVNQLRPALEIAPEAVVVPRYACPSDRQHANGDHQNGRISYALNQWLRQPDVLKGRRLYMVTAATVTDGLSNTAAFSERLSLPWFAPQVIDWSEHPHHWRRGMRRLPELHADFEAYYEACHSRAGKPLSSWFFTEEYNHVMPPNDNSCEVTARKPRGTTSISSAITAGSVHSGGIWMTTLDGAVRFVSSSIDRSVWRHIGTPAGGETDVAF